MSNLPQFDEHTFRAEVFKFMGEMRAYMQFHAQEQAAMIIRVRQVEERVQSLESFRAKILGAITVAGALGGVAGTGITYLLQLIG